ncbi:hypothetical protein [Desulfoscipio gibsoniae]
MNNTLFAHIFNLVMMIIFPLGFLALLIYIAIQVRELKRGMDKLEGLLAESNKRQDAVNLLRDKP